MGDCVYIREPFASNIINLPYEEISTASYTIDEEINNKGKVIRTHFFEVDLIDNQTIKFSPNFISSINGEALKVFFDKVIEINTSEEGNTVTSEHQQKPLELFDNHIKVAYVKVLANYLLSTDEEVKPSQYAEILSFILRIKMEAEERFEIREYILRDTEKLSTDILLTELEDNTTSIEFDVIKTSLFKDLLMLLK